MPLNPGDWRFTVAPMLDWTDRHCRYFHRLLTSRARLYTEMVTTGAIIHGDRDRLLGFSQPEHPVALQLGGSDPADLAESVRIASAYGYDEYNLNCGCPSERVQKGSFGACLMLEPQTVAACVRAMQDVTDKPVTVKHRIGVDDHNEYGFVRSTMLVAASSSFIRARPGSRGCRRRRIERFLRLFARLPSGSRRTFPTR